MKLFLFSSSDVVGISLIIAFLYGHRGEKTPDGHLPVAGNRGCANANTYICFWKPPRGSSALMYVNLFDDVNTRKPWILVFAVYTGRWQVRTKNIWLLLSLEYILNYIRPPFVLDMNHFDSCCIAERKGALECFLHWRVSPFYALCWRGWLFS